jgi:hypothetical protein
VKCIVSSRSWPDIEEALGPATQKATPFLELNEKSVAEAVTTLHPILSSGIDETKEV